MKRSVTAIFFLFVLIAPVVVTFAYLHIHKLHVKKAAKWHVLNHTEKNDLALLKFTQTESKQNLHWKHAAEFEWQGKMYDIVHTESRQDSVFYWCFEDDEESKINKKLSALLNDNWIGNPIRNEQENRLTNFFKSLFHQESKQAKIVLLPTNVHHQHRFASLIFTCAKRPKTPPPQVIF